LQNREAVKAEKAKLKRLRKLSGIYPSISMLNLFQLPLHMVYISLINKLSYNFNISPEMLTEGFFWFQDLSSPDPYCILPVIGGLVNILNMLNTTTTNSSTIIRKMRKYIIILPLMTIPIWMTFPVVSSSILFLTTM
jgi:membrane protein insertase Oxa1/YidC/SpoIIIJ